MASVRIGRVGRPHGLRGQLLIDSCPLTADELESLRELTWRGRNGDERSLVVESAKPMQARLIVRFHGVDHRDVASALTLGELYAEIKFGMKRHRPKAQGSDGKLGNDFVEVKTISPEKAAHKVQVKRKGNFSKLLVVKISESFEFEGRIVDRSALRTGTGKVARFSWPSTPKASK